MRSWSRYPVVVHAELRDVVSRYDDIPSLAVSALPFGNGRSYGDVCLNANGALLRTRRLDRFIHFDRSAGVLCCESGLLLRDILALVVPHGWFLPVTPGTQFVSVGGAIANDVHGKNHHISGSFGHHVEKLELLRSDGTRLICSPMSNPEWFAATVGGLGLTGLITWVELRLIPINSPFVSVASQRFETLNDFWQINAEAEANWPYTVAWIDCVATNKRRGRGIYIRARHAPGQCEMPIRERRSLSVPFELPFSLVNRSTLRMANALYFRAPLKNGLCHYTPFFYPLDSIQNWNRMYGRKGFFQYQCVLPPDSSQDGIDRLLRIIGNSGYGSFLAVLKTFGQRPSPGMLSFPRPGATLALDFPNFGEPMLRLFNELDAVVREARGAIYPAKDARMPGEMFRRSYPRWHEFSRYIDPKFSSSFWRRVMQESG